MGERQSLSLQFRNHIRRFTILCADAYHIALRHTIEESALVARGRGARGLAGVADEVGNADAVQRIP
jgi:hypothetical protein